MPETTALRARAAHCRELARHATDDQTRHILDDMASELEEEAAKLEVEDARSADDAAARSN